MCRCAEWPQPMHRHTAKHALEHVCLMHTGTLACTHTHTHTHTHARTRTCMHTCWKCSSAPEIDIRMHACIQGPAALQFAAARGAASLAEEVARIGPDHTFTALVPDLSGAAAPHNAHAHARSGPLHAHVQYNLTLCHTSPHHTTHCCDPQAARTLMMPSAASHMKRAFTSSTTCRSFWQQRDTNKQQAACTTTACSPALVTRALYEQHFAVSSAPPHHTVPLNFKP
jgi:hypothetical protein